MSRNPELDKFRDLRFEDFARMAGDPSLKSYEKIGFPSMFREGLDQQIFADVREKCRWDVARRILDIGCGCGDLAHIIINASEGKQLLMVDAAEVLQQLPSTAGIVKVEGRFPGNAQEILTHGQADIVICYSVFHYAFAEGNHFDFVDRAAELLAPNGRLLLGDLPNVSKRDRFLSTPAGEAFHRKLMNDNSKPRISQTPELGLIDDSVIASLLQRYRNRGYESYLLPQPEHWPLANSREDILITRYPDAG
jgi:2-polyprenyl-3-methyl-5-hydroxy-6-metoxy-1,4-benzoquinol methylase